MIKIIYDSYKIGFVFVFVFEFCHQQWFLNDVKLFFFILSFSSIDLSVCKSICIVYIWKCVANIFVNNNTHLPILMQTSQYQMHIIDSIVLYNFYCSSDTILKCDGAQSSIESLHEFIFFSVRKYYFCFKYLLNCLKKLVAEKTVARKFYLDILSTDTTISSSQMLYCFEFVRKKSISSKTLCPEILSFLW